MAEHEVTPAELSTILDESAMTAEDKEYVLRGFWAQQEVPEVKSAEQYEVYAKWQIEVEARLKATGVLLGDPAFARSQDGVLATSIGARMIEWEDSLED